MGSRIAKTSVQPRFDGSDLVTLLLHDGDDLDAAEVSIRLEARHICVYHHPLNQVAMQILINARDLIDDEIARLLETENFNSEFDTPAKRRIERRF